MQQDLSSLTRDQACTSCYGKWILNHWTTRDVPSPCISKLYTWWKLKILDLFINNWLCARTLPSRGIKSLPGHPEALRSWGKRRSLICSLLSPQFLKQSLLAHSESESVLSDSLACQVPLSMGIPQARILEWVAMPSSRGSPNPGIETSSPTLQAGSLAPEPPGKTKNTGMGGISLLQGIFPTQESNQGLLHCRQILYQLSYQGNPIHSRDSQIFWI